MKKIIILGLLGLSMACSQKVSDNYTINSPDGNIAVTISIDSVGSLTYNLQCKDSLVLESSKLGLKLSEADFTTGLTIVGASETEEVKDSYQLKNEKREKCTYNAIKQRIDVKNQDGEKLSVVFQVSNDGVAFRYEMEKYKNQSDSVIAESSGFNFPLSAKAWLHPQTDAHTGWNFDQPSYEQYYYTEVPVTTKAPYKAGWAFPALFKSAGSWVLVSEADVDRNYCGSRLSTASPDAEFSIQFPQPLERTDSLAAVKPQITFPFVSPWRVIMVGQTLGSIVESSLITDVSKPCVLKDTTFIKPGKASWSWVLYKDDSTIYSTQKRFIDYASQMHWQYCLIDALWEVKIGYEKIADLVAYANSRNVKIILWYNSAGSWNTTPLTPRNLMFDKAIRNKEFEKISKMGVAGVKVDFWGGDGQSMITYYHDLIEDAAKYKLLVNTHGCTVPRGWSRTYPNLVAMEAVKGFEFCTFTQEGADMQAAHCAMLPFTRNVVGPMDFTPMCFSEIPNLKRNTSNAFELALSVLFQSGIQHYAEVPEGMAKQPEFVKDFIKTLPFSWEDIKFIDGYPGKYAVIARKGNGKWYIAGINSTSEDINLKIDISEFKQKNDAVIITDGNTNREFRTENISNNQVKLQVKPMGGFVIKL